MLSGFAWVKKALEFISHFEQQGEKFDDRRILDTINYIKKHSVKFM